MDTIIEMKNIQKSFFLGTDHELEVLHGIDLSVRQGEFISLVGASGSGKSTLMNIIGALDKQTEGEYLLNGLNVQEAGDNKLAEIRNSQIGFVFQNFNLIPRCNALKNVELPMLYAGVEKHRRLEHAVELMKMVDMKLYRNRYEGTSYDMTKSENKALRPIGVNTQSDVHIIQIYNSLPKDTCCVQWLCMGNAEDSVFIPSFSGITDTYSGYKVNAHNYNAKSLYWNFKSICTLAETDRAYLGKGVRAYWQSQEKKMLSQLPSQIRKTKAAYKKGQSSGRAYVTALGKKTASMEVSNAKRMYSKLIKVATYNQTDASEEMSKIHFKFK